MYRCEGFGIRHCDVTHRTLEVVILDMQRYGVATSSRLLKIIGLFCKRAL